MDIFGLLFEFLFLAMGVYLYFFAIGKVSGKDAEQSARFRKVNGWWLRLLSLALIAVMVVNIVLHIKDLLGQ